MRTLALIAAVSALLLPTAAARADVDSFTGECTLQGTSTTNRDTGPSGISDLGLSATGACSGVLNGDLLTNAQVTASAQTLSLGLTFSGRGALTFVREQTTIAFVIDVIGPLLQLHGDGGGNALAVLNSRQQPGDANTADFDGLLVTVPQIRG